MPFVCHGDGFLFTVSVIVNRDSNCYISCDVALNDVLQTTAESLKNYGAYGMYLGGGRVKYKAFISYSHDDRECAGRLERELNHIAFSKGLYGFSIFRDATYSLLNEDVAEGLKRNLEESEWLIVICSPSVNEPKKYNWVDFECNYFANVLKREKNIVCFISERAPLSGDISDFYPPSIRSYSKYLAAEGRDQKTWFQNVVKVFFCIQGRQNEMEEQAKEVFLLLENSYSDILNDSMKLYQKNERPNALDLLKNIPYCADVKSAEWYFLYAWMTGSAYRGFYGYPKEDIGDRIICIDKKELYLCSMGGSYLIVTDLKNLEVKCRVTPHGGKRFNAALKGNAGQFVTWGEDKVLKCWDFAGGKAECTLSVPLEMTFYPGQPPVFAEFYGHDSNLCLNPSFTECAVITGETLTVVNLEKASKRIFHIPYWRNAVVSLLRWNVLAFSEDGRFLFLADDDTIYKWDLNGNEGYTKWSRREHGSMLPCKKNEDTPVQIEHGGLWNKESELNYRTDVTVVCDRKDYFLLSFSDGTLAVWDLRINADDGNFLGGSLQTLPQDGKFQKVARGLCAVSGKWIAYTDDKKWTIRICTRQGKLERDREICERDKVKPMSAEELGLSRPYGQLIFDYIHNEKNPNLFVGTWLEFVDEDTLLVVCSKGRQFLWKIAEDEWTEINKKDIGPGPDFGTEDQDFYITQDGRRRVESQEDELVFFRIADGKEIIRIPFSCKIKAFHFLKDETILIIIGMDAIYRYEIPRLPDEPDTFLDELFLERRKELLWKQNM